MKNRLTKLVFVAVLPVAMFATFGLVRTLAVESVVPEPGPNVLRRLTRYEYDRTLSALIGLEVKSSEDVGMPADTTSSHFDNLAVNLNVPPSLLEKYENQADHVLERLVGDEKGRVTEIGDHWAAQKSHDEIFLKKQLNGATTRDAADQILQRFATIAYRRPVAANELEPMLRLFELGQKRAMSFEKSVALSLKAIMLSPNFLFRMERDAPESPAGGVTPVDDVALASRLSYFLWSSPPDAELMKVAESKHLGQPAEYEKQIIRMLADPKAKALTENFAGQWLQIRNLPKARPSQEFFPTFDSSLREAMYNETSMFFDNLRTANRPVLDLLESDYTFLNDNLAKHYGVAGVTGEKLRLVKLKPEDHRGGMLGMGSVLSMTSHTYRTSPTLRGKWILEVIFGTPPPPPPPGVSQIANEAGLAKKGTTFRELMVTHASQPACAGCHKFIDPMGFTLENYDAIGRWRTKQGDKPLDASGQLPTGEKLNGVDELKDLVVKRKPQFVRNMAEQMLVYAIGRETISTDKPALDRIVKNYADDWYSFQRLVLEVANSAPFRYRHNSGPVQLVPVKKIPAVKPKPTSNSKAIPNGKGK
ncbi:MAG: DUF1592 domain-containing protein [Chthonomonadales bacterium]